MKKLDAVRWGVVGTGTIAQQFVEDIKLVSGSKVTAVCSRSLSSASKLGQLCKDASCFCNLAEFMQDETIDVVYVATPNHTHFDIALASLKAGKSVLVEKPLVMSSAEIEKLQAAVKANHVLLMEGIWTHFLPVIDHVHKHLNKGGLGTIKRIDADLAFQHPFDAESRFYDKSKGGGALLDLGIYPLSLAIAFMGKPDRVDGCCNAAPERLFQFCQSARNIGPSSILT